MKFYVNSRGTTGVSMGPLGWLLFGWLYLAALALIASVWLLYALAVAVAWLVRKGAEWAGERLGARRAREVPLRRLV